jgi:hypothetical protein
MSPEPLTKDAVDSGRYPPTATFSGDSQAVVTATK